MNHNFEVIKETEGIYLGKAARETQLIQTLGYSLQEMAAKIQYSVYNTQKEVWEAILEKVFLEKVMGLEPEFRKYKAEDDADVFTSFGPEIIPHVSDPLDELTSQELFGIYLGRTHYYKEKGRLEITDNSYYYWYPELDKIRIRRLFEERKYYPGKRPNISHTNTFKNVSDIDLPEKIGYHFDYLQTKDIDLEI